MKIFYKEAEKFFLQNRGYWIFIVFLLVQIVSVFSQAREYEDMREEHKKRYSEYLEAFGGKVNEEKIEKLEAEKKHLEELDKKWEQLLGRLDRGEISPEEYDKELILCDGLNEKKLVFQKIQNQYDNAEKNPERCFIMDESGWYMVMHSAGFSIFPVVCVIFIAIRIFCTEYESGMYGIISSSNNGKTKTVLSKLLLVFLGAVFCAVLSAGILLMAAKIKFGLGPADYPIQSLSYFAACPYAVSIGQGFLAIWLMKAVALCLIGLVAAAFCIGFKKSVPVFFISVVTGALPYFLFPLEFLLKYIPYLGLFLSGCYFRGMERTNVQSQMQEAVPIPFRNLAGACVSGVFLAVFLAAFSVRFWNNHLKRGKNTYEG